MGIKKVWEVNTIKMHCVNMHQSLKEYSKISKSSAPRCGLILSLTPSTQDISVPTTNLNLFLPRSPNFQIQKKPCSSLIWTCSWVQSHSLVPFPWLHSPPPASLAGFSGFPLFFLDALFQYHFQLLSFTPSFHIRQPWILFIVSLFLPYMLSLINSIWNDTE